MKIGVLALQGAVIEHQQSFSKLNVKTVPVKLPKDLDGLQGLVIPGGESTTISKLLSDYFLMGPLKKLVAEGFPVWGTCAGLILLAKEILDSEIDRIGCMDIKVRRNAYGRQIDSFEMDLDVPQIGPREFHAVFIRAPTIESTKSNVEILCKIDKMPVVVRQKNMLACSFHPELTDDLRFHHYFISMIKGEVFAADNN
jgi:pyridoxal 5'-phosphate synthase pdxT subunit